MTLIGKRFGRGVILEELRLPITQQDRNNGMNVGVRGARVKCDCGSFYLVSLAGLKRGVDSCGCLIRERQEREKANWTPIPPKPPSKAKGVDVGTKLLHVGERYGRGVIVEVVRVPGSEDRQHPRGHWGGKMLCDCGETYYAIIGNLRAGHKKSCGCLYRDITSGRKGSKE